MKVGVYNAKSYDREFFNKANSDFGHELTFSECPLTVGTENLATGFPAVCVFVHDELNAKALRVLARNGMRLVALRCAGFNNVDLRAAEKAGINRSARAGLFPVFRRRAHRRPDADLESQVS